MANHVYFTIEFDNVTGAEFDSMLKSEEREYEDYRGQMVKTKELVEIENLPCMELVEKSFDEDGNLEGSYSWYCDNIGAKWCHIEDWEYNLTGYSAWCSPAMMVENMCIWLSTKYNKKVSAIMTYEDEFRNFFGRDEFESYETEGEWDCTWYENSIEGNTLNAQVEVEFPSMKEDDFDWDEYSEKLDKCAYEYADDLVYAFFEDGEWDYD